MDVNNHINKINNYKAYTISIINKYNEMMFNISKNYTDYVTINVKTAKAWMVSQNHSFTFEYATLRFYLPDNDKTILAAALVISANQEQFIQSLINILERTDLLNKHQQNDAGFINSDVGKEHIEYINKNIKEVKNIMVKLTISNRLVKK